MHRTLQLLLMVVQNAVEASPISAEQLLALRQRYSLFAPVSTEQLSTELQCV